MISSPKVRNEISDIMPKRRRQASKTDNPAGLRIIKMLDGRDYGWLAEKAGIPASTISDYVQRGISRADSAVKIATALGTTVEFLINGTGAGENNRTARLIDVADADWVEVPEYSLLEIDELGKLEPVVTTMMRRDWLYTTLGDTSGIWIARLFARYDPLDIDYGAALFCKDCKPGDRLGDGLYYLFRTNGAIIMAPFTSRDSGAADDAVHRRDIGAEEDQYQPVARVIGQFARPV